MRSKEADHYISTINERKKPYFKMVNKIKLRIDEGVYPTGKIGKLFSKALALPKIGLDNTKKVLDYGTGTGFLAIAAAKKGAKVVALDKNPMAIDCAIYNAKKNNVKEQIDFRVSNNLSAILENEKFDIIVAGLPWESACPNTPLEMAFYDQDFSMRIDLANKAINMLVNEFGIILLSYSKRVEEKVPIKNFFPDFDVKILLEKTINNEPHYIYIFNCKAKII